MSSLRRELKALRPVALAVAMVGCLAGLLITVNGYYPLARWLFVLYGRYWVLCAFWALSCLSAGHLCVTAGLRLRLPVRELLVVSCAAGVLVFVLGLFVVGLVGGLGAVTFFAWPAVMLAGGLWPLYRHLRRVWTRARALGVRSRPLTPIGWAAVLFGMAGLLLVYLPILTPANVAYDAHWYHLAIAERYASTGTIDRFAEGWYPGCIPHLSSLIYTWAFLAPGFSLFSRIALAAHLEFTLFVATLASVPVLVRWLLRGAGARHSWAAVFLFAGIFRYDSSLSLAADHVLAFWAVPIFLAFRGAWRAPSPGHLVLFAAATASAILTKYQASYLVALPWAALTARAAFWLASRDHRRPALMATLAAVGAVLLFTAPHWLKNWLWYGNPVYPLAQQIFNGTPWNPSAEIAFADTAWRPAGTGFGKVVETVQAMFTFAFVPHDWWVPYGLVPVFGFLFTLLLVPLPFLRDAGRLWSLAGFTLGGVFIWYWTSHQDRYLQALVPWMAAFVVAALVLAWRQSANARWPVTRSALVALVGVQAVWGADAFSFPVHAMINDTPIKRSIDFISSGYRKAWHEREETGAMLAPLTGHLTTRDTLLAHNRHLILGSGTRVVQDLIGDQGAIHYPALATPRAIADHLAGLGVTHLAWEPTGTSLEKSLTSELVFSAFVKNWVKPVTRSGATVMGRMPETPPPPEPPPTVLVVACPGARLVPLEQVQAAAQQPRLPEEVATADAARPATLAVSPEGCGPRSTLPSHYGFEQLRAFGGHILWARPARK